MSSSSLSVYPEFEKLILAMLPAVTDTSTLALFWVLCEQQVDWTCDDDLFFELQTMYETKASELGLQKGIPQ